MIERFETSERSSQAVRYAGLVFVAGQVARDAAGSDIATQTREVLARIDRQLARAGSRRDLLLNATIWLRRAGDFPGMSAEWAGWLPPGSAPARAVIEGGTMQDGWDVEIAVTAAAATGP